MLTDDGEVLYLLRNAEQSLVVGHAGRLPVMPKPDHHNSVILLQMKSNKVSTG